MSAQTMEQLVSLCKRRGFIFPGSAVYGGMQGTYDYGPLGVELKNNLKLAWWRANVWEREDMEGIDAAILMNKLTWRYSGHEETFVDPMVDCRGCKLRWRADQISGKCPSCGSSDLTEPRPFNLMFKTQVGPVPDPESFSYLRPETAQGIFVNFKHVLDSTARKLPFGIAQMGKAFRNEITPRNFIFRVREFEQMEIEFFVRPGEDERWFEYWREQRMAWQQALLRSPAKLRWHQHGPGELAHYAKAAYDIEYEFPFGWNEFEGIHNRTDFDLSRHQQTSGKKLEYFDQERNERYLPYIIETSLGADRLALVVLCDAYDEDVVEGESRVVLRFRPEIAPIKAAVLPLVKKDGMPEIARRIYDELRGRFTMFYDDGGSIGRRYRRQDEAGTPFAITVDGQTGQDGTVTVRHRDTLAQDRVASAALGTWLAERLAT